MQNIAHFLRYISLTHHQHEHYSLHTSNTYFLQSTHYVTPTKPQGHGFPRTQALHMAWQGDRPRNIQKTSSGSLRNSQSLWRFRQSCFLYFAGFSNTLNYNWYCADGKEFPVAVEDGNGVPSTINYIQVSKKSTDKVTGQNITVPGGDDNICTK